MAKKKKSGMQASKAKLASRSLKKVESKNSCGCSWTGKQWSRFIIAEVAFYFTVYYFLYLLQIPASLWTSSLALWVLINIAVLVCPVTWNNCNC